MDDGQALPWLADGRVLGLRALDPEQVRGAILAEHERIRAILKRLEVAASALLACSVPNARQRRATRRLALHLCDMMSAHMALENELFVPVLERVDAWGRVRSRQMLDDHAAQMQTLQTYAEALADTTRSGQELALTAWHLIQTIHEDMQSEEAGILSAELLSDWTGARNVETG